MTRVIAVQLEQMNTFKEVFNKNLQSAAVVNNANVLSESLNFPMSEQSSAQIDMESQTVNLNPASNITNSEVTNEVFGPQISNDFAMPVFPGTPVVNDNIVENKDMLNEKESEVNIPYQEPNLTASVPVSVLSDDSYFELLNSLRNMITDFANNAYAAIDKYQEEKLQGKNTGANLIDQDSIPVIQDNKEMVLPSPMDSGVMSQNSANTFDNQSSDLDNTIVIPGNFLTNAINDLESDMKLAA